MVENPAYNAKDMGSIPGQETKIPHASGQLVLPRHNQCSPTEILRAATKT